MNRRVHVTQCTVKRSHHQESITPSRPRMKSTSTHNYSPSCHVSAWFDYVPRTELMNRSDVNRLMTVCRRQNWVNIKWTWRDFNKAWFAYEHSLAIIILFSRHLWPLTVRCSYYACCLYGFIFFPWPWHVTAACLRSHPPSFWAVVRHEWSRIWTKSLLFVLLCVRHQNLVRLV